MCPEFMRHQVRMDESIITWSKVSHHNYNLHRSRVVHSLEVEHYSPTEGKASNGKSFGNKCRPNYSKWDSAFPSCNHYQVFTHASLPKTWSAAKLYKTKREHGRRRWCGKLSAEKLEQKSRKVFHWENWGNLLHSSAIIYASNCRLHTNLWKKIPVGIKLLLEANSHTVPTRLAQ